MSRGRHIGRLAPIVGAGSLDVLEFPGQAPRAPRASARRHHGQPVRRALHAAEATVATLLLVGVAAFALGGFVFHLGLSPVLSGSMTPTFRAGDALITRPVAVTSLRPGDVAVFVPPGESAPYAHRITSVTPTGDGGVVVTTQGDANPAPDAWHATLHGPQVSRVVTTVPEVGRVMVAVSSPLARALIIAVIGLLLTGIGTQSLLRSPGYRLSPAR